jgi:hypothetical protein
LSENFVLAASTEGASKLQVLQPGAQNQKATGFCASASLRENDVPEPMVRAVNSFVSKSPGTTREDSVAFDDGVEPHEARVNKATPTTPTLRSNFIAKHYLKTPKQVIKTTQTEMIVVRHLRVLGSIFPFSNAPKG